MLVLKCSRHGYLFGILQTGPYMKQQTYERSITPSGRWAGFFEIIHCFAMCSLLQLHFSFCCSQSVHLHVQLCQSNSKVQISRFTLQKEFFCSMNSLFTACLYVSCFSMHFAMTFDLCYCLAPFWQFVFITYS